MFNYYYNNFCENSSEKLKKKSKQKLDSNNAEYVSLISSLTSINSRPDFSNMENILSTNDAIDSIKKELDENLGVIVETRKLKELAPVVKNFIEQTDLNVQLFCGLDNFEFILNSEIRKYIEQEKLNLIQLKTSNLMAPEYNALLLSKKFWEMFRTRKKVFIFQTDGIICPQSDFDLNDFLSFDYIGSRWNRKRPIDLVIDGGCGGVSIRDWSKSIECLDRFNPNKWPGGEDGYFAFHIDLIGGQVGRNSDCEKFSTQEFFSCKSYAAHQISCLNKYQQKKFIKYCPEAEFLL